MPAHAYLFYPDAADLTEEAGARLAALADYTELGSGFKVAMRDLELRGAGNLLGDEQTGHVAAVGFELYCELLAEAVADLQGQAPPAVASAVRVDAAVDAYIPSTYVGHGGRQDGRPPPDRAGRAPRTTCASWSPSWPTGSAPIPEPVANLIGIQAVRIALAPLGAVALSVRRDRIALSGLTLGADDIRGPPLGHPRAALHGRQTRALAACSGGSNRNGGGNESCRWYIRSTR